MHVRDVEYVERGCERLRGTLYMTTFRLVFAPDNEFNQDNVVSHVLFDMKHVCWEIIIITVL